MCITFSPAVYAQFNSTLDGMPLLFVASKQGLKIVRDDHFWVPCHFSFRSAVDHAMLCSSMKMEVPGLADSLQQYLCGNSGIYAGDVLDTDPGWQQSKLIWALSAEVGLASRMHCTSLWHVKAAQLPFPILASIAFSLEQLDLPKPSSAGSKRAATEDVVFDGDTKSGHFRFLLCIVVGMVEFSPTAIPCRMHRISFDLRS